MILSICLNCSLDTRYSAPDFMAGSIHSVTPPSITAGGKGLNLARVAAQLGAEVTALGLVGERDLDFFTQAMAAEGITANFTPVPTPTRRCLNIIDPNTNTSTELLEQGYPLEPEYFHAILDLVEKLAPRAKVVCASGSVPPGLPVDVYAQLGELARRLDKPFVLDARGPHLREGLRAHPYAIKPNLVELEAWAGTPLKTEAEVAAALTRLNQAGVEIATVSLGEAGAITAHRGKLCRTLPPQVTAANPVGSGDAFCAGLALGIAKKLTLTETLAWAVASGTANAMHPETGHIEINTLEQLLPQIKIIEMGGLN